MNNSFSMSKSPLYPQCSRQRSYKSFSSIRQKSKTQLKVSNYNSVQTEQASEQEILQHQKLDNEFIVALNQVEMNLPQIGKHERIRIELWLKKLCEVTTNFIWKQNRNLYITVLQDMLKNNMLCDPFIHVPPEGPLPRLSKHDLILPWQKTQKSTPIKYNSSQGLERGGSVYSQLSVKNSHNKTIQYNNVNSLRTPIPKSKSKSICSQQQNKSNFSKAPQTLNTYQSEQCPNLNNFNFTTDENYFSNDNNFNKYNNQDNISSGLNSLDSMNNFQKQQQYSSNQRQVLDQINFENSQNQENVNTINMNKNKQGLQQNDILPFIQKINEIELEKVQLQEINKQQKQKINMLEQKLITQNTIAEQFQERLKLKEQEFENINQQLQQQTELNSHFNDLTNTFVSFITKNIQFILQNKKKLDTQLQYLQIMNDAENLGKILNYNFTDSNNMSFYDKSIDNFANSSMDKQVNNIFQEVQQRFDKANHETEKFEHFLDKFKDNISNLSHNNSMNCTNNSLIFNQTQNGNYFNKSFQQNKNNQNNINNNSVNTWQNESVNNKSIQQQQQSTQQ